MKLKVKKTTTPTRKTPFLLTTFLLTTFLLSGFVGFCQKTYIPDANFRRYFN